MKESHEGTGITCQCHTDRPQLYANLQLFLLKMQKDLVLNQEQALHMFTKYPSKELGK